jgi:hypothetical protein
VPTFLRVDDIFAALIVFLVMLRRIEVKAAMPEQNPHVPAASFDHWRTLAMRAYDRVAVASVLKVVCSGLWYLMAPPLGAPWFQLGGLLIFLGWMASLIAGWKTGTSAGILRRQLGIVLRRRAT